MPTLKLESLVCNTTEDYTGDDEIYISVKGKQVWGPTDMNTSPPGHKTKSIDKEVKFTKKVRIDLWDEDTGWGDDDDHLGRTYAYAEDAGKGELEYVFRGCGSNYRLTYQVMS